jgi:lipoprotein LprG
MIRRYLPISIVFLILLSSCGQSTPEPLPPELIVENCVDRMQTVSSFHFLIDRTGFPAFLDTNQTLAFSRAEGDFQSPDRATAAVRVIGPGIVAEIDIISVAENQWETNLLSGEWQALPPNWGFNPASLFDHEIGIQSILQSDLYDLTLRGSEELVELPGQLLYALEGTLDGDGLYRLSYGMIGPESLQITLYITPETFELYRLNIVQHRPEEENDTFWQIDFWEFEKELNIVPPILVEDTDS